MKITPQDLTTVAASLLALLIGYAPFIKDWYDKRTTAEKVSIMGIALTVTALGILGLSCTAIGSQYLDVTCDQFGLVVVIKCLFAALTGSQATYILLVRPFKPLSPAPAGAQTAVG